MDVQVNWLAVLLAALSTLAVGSVWYTPKVFGNLWMRLTKVKPGKDSSPGLAIGLSFVASFLTAYILAHVAFLAHNFFGNSFLQDALSTGFWLWLGFTAARLFVHDIFERRPLQLTVLNAAHECVTIMVMAFIIGTLRP